MPEGHRDGSSEVATMKQTVILWAVGCILVAAEARAQRAPYQVTVRSQSYSGLQTFSTHTFQATGALPATQEGEVELTLPFTFNFFGTDYDRVIAHTNGVVSFEPLQQTGGFLSAPRQVPRARDALDGYIAGVWQNLQVGSGELRTATSGSMGQRTFVIEYAGFESGSGGAGSTDANFRIELDEDDFGFRVWFGRVFGISNGTTAAEDDTGRDGVNLLASSASCDASCACEPGRCSAVGGNWTSGRLIEAELPPGPELYGQIDGPPGARPGTAFDASLLVDNGGLSQAPAFDAGVYLSPSAGDLSQAVRLGTVSLGPLAATSSVTATASFTVPAGQSVSAQWLILQVDDDDDVAEAIETNNLFSVPFGTGPDLTGTVRSVPVESGAGELLPVGLQVRTDGAALSETAADVFLSVDDTFDGGDRRLGRRTITLPDGFSTETTLEVTVPADVPTGVERRVIVRLDPDGDVSELDETNNDLVSEPLRFTPAELGIRNLTAVGSAYRGEPLPVRFDLQNDGGSTASGFTACVFLTGAGMPSSQDLVFESELLQLDSFRDTSLNVDVEVPEAVQLGRIGLFARVDCRSQVSEDDETDNLLRVDVEVFDRGPDLLPRLLDVAARGQAGEPLPLTVRVENRGPVAVVPEVVLELLPPQLSGGSERRLPVPWPADSLPPRREVDRTATVSLPKSLPSGTYRARVRTEVADDVNPDNDADPNDAVDPEGLPAVRIDGFGLAIASATPPRGSLGQPYRHAFVGLGGLPDQQIWTLLWGEAGAPPGIAFDAGRLEGRPEAVGDFPFTITLESGDRSIDAEGVFSVDEAAPDLVLVDRVLPPAVANAAYRTNLQAIGGTPPYRFSVREELAFFFLSEDGSLSGVAPAPRTFIIPVQVTDATGARIESMLALDVLDPDQSLSIDLPALPNGLVGRPYDVTVPVSGGDPPYRFRLEGELPEGMRFDADSGTFEGTPARSGLYPLVLQVRDGTGLFDRDPFVFEIIEAGSLFIPRPELPTARLDQPYEDVNGDVVTLDIEGVDPDSPVTWMVGSGFLPPGMALEGPRLVGTPTELGVYPFEVLALDDRGDVARQYLGIEVRPPRSQDTVESGGGCRGAPAGPGSMWALWAFWALLGAGWRRSGWRGSGRGLRDRAAGPCGREVQQP